MNLTLKILRPRSFTSARARLQSIESVRWKYPDAVVGIQREQVGVPCHDVRCMAAHSKFEELVVLRITTGRNLHVNLNPFSFARQSREKIPNILLIHVSKEFLPAKNFVQFGERRKRDQDSSLLESYPESITRLRIRQEQRTD
jgi:hypothetical protein